MNVRVGVTDDEKTLLAIVETTKFDKGAYVCDQLQRGNVRVALRDGTTVGFAICNREFFDVPFVWFVAVAPERRRTGVAGALLASIEREYAGSRIYSSTNESHAVMRRFFERRGYVRAGKIDLDPGDPEVFYRLDLW